MALFVSSVKDLLSIKVKPRHDGYTDQISRLVVTKIFVVCSLVMGLDWFQTTVICLPPKDTKMPQEFIHDACWIKGFYVFPELSKHMQMSGYYGIPLDLEIDGRLKDYKGNSMLSFCKTMDKLYKRNENCKPMQKQYFMQYQWMPFYSASLSILFYLPYICFRIVNTDLVSLKTNLNKEGVKMDDLIDTYFNHKVNSINIMRLRIMLNIVIKFMYVTVNCSAFFITNALLNYSFTSYGQNWINWVRQNSSMAFDFELKTTPTPGNEMLPIFGICELYEARLDGTTSYTNKASIICEVSSHLLYQYVFLILWFLLLTSISVACFGVVLYVGENLRILCVVKTRKSLKYISDILTLRECEYLEFVRKKDIAMYDNIIRILQEKKLSIQCDGRSKNNSDSIVLSIKDTATVKLERLKNYRRRKLSSKSLLLP